MKTQIQKSAHSRRTFSAEYQDEALALWRQSGRSAAKVGAELGIRPSLLYKWAKVRRGGPPPRAPPPPQPEVAQLQAEIRRLTAENAKLLEQREVLKKSLGILSETPPRSMPGSSK
jgi:transposase